MVIFHCYVNVYQRVNTAKHSSNSPICRCILQIVPSKKILGISSINGLIQGKIMEHLNIYLPSGYD